MQAHWNELSDEELRELFHGRFGDAKDAYSRRTGHADGYEACRFAQYIARVVATATPEEE